MAHNQEMLESNAAEWGDKVRIVAVSIDNDIETVFSLVNTNGWTSVEHYHRSISSVQEDYGVINIPFIILVDGKGNIAFRGHPAQRKIEDDINTLLKGEPLVGI